MTTTRRVSVACVLGAALALTGCAGAAPGGSVPVAPPARTAGVPTARDAAATGAPSAAAPAPATADADDAARAACVEIDAMPLPGDDLALLEEQARRLAAAGEHMRAATAADPGYLDDAEAVAAVAANAADAIALLQENGADVDAWDVAAQQAWSAYVDAQVGDLFPLYDLCNRVDPPDGGLPGD